MLEKWDCLPSNSYLIKEQGIISIFLTIMYILSLSACTSVLKTVCCLILVLRNNCISMSWSHLYWTSLNWMSLNVCILCFLVIIGI